MYVRLDRLHSFLQHQPQSRLCPQSVLESCRSEAVHHFIFAVVWNTQSKSSLGLQIRSPYPSKIRHRSSPRVGQRMDDVAVNQGPSSPQDRYPQDLSSSPRISPHTKRKRNPFRTAWDRYVLPLFTYHTVPQCFKENPSRAWWSFFFGFQRGIGHSIHPHTGSPTCLTYLEFGLRRQHSLTLTTYLSQHQQNAFGLL